MLANAVHHEYSALTSFQTAPWMIIQNKSNLCEAFSAWRKKCINSNFQKACVFAEINKHLTFCAYLRDAGATGIWCKHPDKHDSQGSKHNSPHNVHQIAHNV